MSRNVEDPNYRFRGSTPLAPPWITNDPYATSHSPPIRQRTYSSPQLPHMSFNQDFTFNGQQPIYHPPRAQSTYGPLPKPPSPSPAQISPGAPSLTAPLPQLSVLQAAVQTIQNPNHDPALRIAWARDVIFLVDKHVQANTGSSSTDAPVGPAIITDPQLQLLVQTAVPTVLQLAAAAGPGPIPPPIAEALYLRATFAASGAYPEHVQHNPRLAFRDFESAARGGYAGAWFRLGRDYENFNDATHARDCFERGVKLGVESCIYRMGMAHLMGQLAFPANPTLALPLLHRAATLATPQLPQPAYIFALLLLSEFSALPSPLSASLFQPFIPHGSTQLLEARRHLERSAYLGFAPAQYKLGHAYEFAQPPFTFDPLLSVQYYSLASQQGEVEADMALSKWFLCGSGPQGSPNGDDGGFEKDEALAWTFAEKAARKGLPSAEFAMGYYAEVGVGGPKDLQSAIRWYTKAKDHGNTDASERLVALSQPSPAALSRDEHDTITENKLVRKRTLAKQRSDTQQQQLGDDNSDEPQPRELSQPQESHQLQESYQPQEPHQPQELYQPQYLQQQSEPYQVPATAPPPHQGLPSSPYPSQNPNARRQDGRQVLDAIRRSSLAPPPASSHVHANTLPPGTLLTPAQQYQQYYVQDQGQGRPPYPHPYPHPQHSNTLPTPRPQQYASPNMNRYTLTDSPVPRMGSPIGIGERKSPGPASGRKSPGRPGRGRGGGRMGSYTAPPTLIGEDDNDGIEPGATIGAGGGLVMPSKPSKGPTTFAEMGFQGAKAEDKECIIM